MDIINEIIQQLENKPLWDSWYIKEKIGTGAFSAVYKVEAVRQNRTDVSALKIESVTADGQIFTNEAQKKSTLDRKKVMIENESSIMYKLKSCPNIVQYEEELTRELYINGNFEGYYFLIRMELLTNVYDMIRKGNFDFSESNIIKLALDICQGLKAAHDINVIHRDIKPANFFVSTNGTYKLGDFNISKQTTSTRSFAGTNGYIAPEVYRTKNDAFSSYTKQADIYSLGICLYQMMNNGLFPLENDRCSADDAIDMRMQNYPFNEPINASPAFASVIMKACTFDTIHRYQNIDEMISDINSIIGGENPNSSRSYSSYDPNRTQYAESSGYQPQQGGYTPPPSQPFEVTPPPAPPVTPPNPPTLPPVPPPTKNKNNIVIILIILLLFVIVAALAAIIFFGGRGNDSENSGDNFISPDFAANISGNETKNETIKETTVVSQQEEQTRPADDEPTTEPITEIQTETTTESTTTTVITTTTETTTIIETTTTVITTEAVVITEPPVKEMTNFYDSVFSVSASSQLKDETIDSVTHNYSPSKAIDSDFSTCWVEGTDGYGIGEEITVEFNDTYSIEELWIFNGLCTSEDLYYKNSRLHDITLIFSNGDTRTFECLDGWDNKKNVILFPERIETSSVTIRIDSVFEGDKYSDTCISEIYIP